jgi:hypothetical protein
MSQLNPVNLPKSIFLKTHLNITKLGLNSGVFSYGFPTKTPYTLLPPNACYMPSTSYFSRIYNRTTLGEKYRSLSASILIFLQTPVTASLLGTNIPLNTLFSITLSLRSFLKIVVRTFEKLLRYYKVQS